MRTRESIEEDFLKSGYTLAELAQISSLEVLLDIRELLMENRTSEKTSPVASKPTSEPSVGEIIGRFQRRHHRKPSGEEMSAMFL